MFTVYVFKVSSQHRKSLWRKIEIQADQTLGNLDSIIREAFKYDQHDHLSSFFKGKAWSTPSFGDIKPGGKGSGASIKITTLRLKVGDKLDYVYDYGSSVYNTVELIEVKDKEPSSNYPRISEKNKQRNTYCERCKSNGKKVVALYLVYNFEDDSVERLCQKCMEEAPEEVDISEIVY